MIPKLAGYELPGAAEVPKSKVKWEIEPARAALLIHDMQEYFSNFWGEKSPFVDQLVTNIARLKCYCKATGIPVYYTAQPTDQKPEDRALLTDVWGIGIDTAPQLSGIIDQLKPDNEDVVLVKHRYSAFQKSDFREQLKAKQRDQLIICGVYAHIGCMVSATDAFMMDIQPFFVADALGDFSRDQHLMSLSYVAECVGRVQIQAEIEERLLMKDINSVICTALDGDEDGPEEDDNLIDYNVNSMQIMSFLGRWRKVQPKLDFQSLGNEPTIKAWRGLILKSN